MRKGPVLVFNLVGSVDNYQGIKLTHPDIVVAQFTWGDLPTDFEMARRFSAHLDGRDYISEDIRKLVNTSKKYCWVIDDKFSSLIKEKETRINDLLRGIKKDNSELERLMRP